jgi:hypothetical protein
MLMLAGKGKLEYFSSFSGVTTGENRKRPFI